MTRPADPRFPDPGFPDPEFLSPEGERAWTWLRRHLDRANAFWLAFILTDDLTAQRMLRERVRANRRMRALPLTVLQPATPAELAGLLDELEARGAAPPGCTWVAAPQLADDEWLAAWRTFLLTMNHRRDVLRARLGGLVIAAPPAVKVVAQRESPDLWSVRDLLIELAARPVVTRRAAVPPSDVEPHYLGGSSSQGLSYESGDAGLAEEAQVLLAMPVAELAGPSRERVSRAVHQAAGRREDQLAAVLLLAQSDGYRAAGDPAGALHLVQEGLTLEHVEPRTRERLLNSGVELAGALSELELAQRYAAELVALTKQRVSPEDPEALRDLSYSLNRLGDAIRDLGDPATATAPYLQALDIRRRLADQLNTDQAHRDLAWSLNKLGDVISELGDPATARTHYQQALDIRRRLADQLDSPQDLSDFAQSLTSLGAVISELGDPATAATHYQQALDIRRRLADQLDTPQALRDLTWGLNDLGDLTSELGDPATHYQQALDIARRLADQLDTPRALWDLSINLAKLGDATLKLGDPATAATLHQQALDIARRLADQLDTPQARRDLSWILSLSKLSDATHDRATAAAHYQQALDIRQRLVQQLDTPQVQRDLAYTLNRLGDITRDLGDPTTARIHHQQALGITRRLAQQLSTAPVLQDLQKGLTDLIRTEEELGNADAATTLRAELATVSDQLAALSDDAPGPPPNR
ncbi:MAG: tetratricopeptide repeat protein [Pseudonocardiaceae bacterium]